MKNHDIKTVEMTRTIRDRHYQQLKDRTGSERISFYRQKAQALYAKLEKLARSLLNAPKASCCLLGWASSGVGNQAVNIGAKVTQGNLNGINSLLNLDQVL